MNRSQEVQRPGGKSYDNLLAPLSQVIEDARQSPAGPSLLQGSFERIRETFWNASSLPGTRIGRAETGVIPPENVI